MRKTIKSSTERKQAYSRKRSLCWLPRNKHRPDNARCSQAEHNWWITSQYAIRDSGEHVEVVKKNQVIGKGVGEFVGGGNVWVFA